MLLHGRLQDLHVGHFHEAALLLSVLAPIAALECARGEPRGVAQGLRESHLRRAIGVVNAQHDALPAAGRLEPVVPLQGRVRLHRRAQHVHRRDAHQACGLPRRQQPLALCHFPQVWVALEQIHQVTAAITAAFPPAPRFQPVAKPLDARRACAGQLGGRPVPKQGQLLLKSLLAGPQGTTTLSATLRRLRHSVLGSAISHLHSLRQGKPSMLGHRGVGLAEAGVLRCIKGTWQQLEAASHCLRVGLTVLGAPEQDNHAGEIVLRARLERLAADRRGGLTRVGTASQALGSELDDLSVGKVALRDPVADEHQEVCA
mmetsp:Transcript_36566/g.94405  ORF Transcript_36566/g.94405 Transcript_36566/m.94405 type:complete len:316 (+) Transcript_36566:543-1490(+)